jgi:NSS family neurotransmitter:Na+ symporter
MSTCHPNISKTTWKSQGGFIWSLIGSAVGFANILSFSAQVYKNGGGAFLIPYAMALFLLGIPLLILEGIIGSRFQTPLVAAYGKAAGKVGKIFGWLGVLACLSIGAFYIVLTGYSVAYTFFSATNSIPQDAKAFFLDSFLKITPSLSDFGTISIPILLSMLLVAAVTWFVLVRNVRDGIEKVCSFFMPLLAIIMAIFAVIVTFLPGGIDGWIYYLKPDFSKLLEPSLWRDVFGQLFFSLSLGLGIIVGYSRHTGKATNVPRAMLYVALGDFAVSFISGAAIFGCMAHISYAQQIPFSSILTTESTFEIGFIIFPQLLKFFGPFVAQWVGVIFFFCIFIAGITGLFSIVESVAGNFEVEFRITRKQAVAVSLTALASLATFFCMGNASHIIDVLVPMVLGTNMLIGGLGLIFAFQYLCKEIREDAQWHRKGHLSFHAFCLRFVAPLLLGLILIGNLVQEFSMLNLAMVLRWSWLAIAILVSVFLMRKSAGRAVEMLPTQQLGVE